jgi:hypothetical protein
METKSINYFPFFIKSKWHHWFAFSTIAMGLLSATALGVIIGFSAYFVGLLLIPETSFFKNKINSKMQKMDNDLQLMELEKFKQRRDRQIASLSSENRASYYQLANVCKDVERATKENSSSADDIINNSRLRKLDDLMWTYLRLLKMEENLRVFLEMERKENISDMIIESTKEIEKINRDIEECADDKTKLEYKQRFLSSRMERLEVLKKRKARVEISEQNIALTSSERDRLEQQLKLLRGDALATKSTEGITMRIDASLEQLNETNKLLVEMDDFVTTNESLPNTVQRVGFGEEKKSNDFDDNRGKPTKKISIKRVGRYEEQYDSFPKNKKYSLYEIKKVTY